MKDLNILDIAHLGVDVRVVLLPTLWVRLHRISKEDRWAIYENYSVD